MIGNTFNVPRVHHEALTRRTSDKERDPRTEKQKNKEAGRSSLPTRKMNVLWCQSCKIDSSYVQTDGLRNLRSWRHHIWSSSRRISRVERILAHCWLSTIVTSDLWNNELLSPHQIQRLTAPYGNYVRFASLFSIKRSVFRTWFSAWKRRK